MKNPFIQLMVIIWTTSMVAAVFTKDTSPFGIAGAITLFAGIAYCCTHY